jgi:hypothetical protein
MALRHAVSGRGPSLKVESLEFCHALSANLRGHRGVHGICHLRFVIKKRQKFFVLSGLLICAGQYTAVPLVVEDLLFDDFYALSGLFKGRVELKEGLQGLIIGLRLVQVVDLDIEGDGHTDVKHVLLHAIAKLLYLIEEGRLLRDNVMKLQVVDHLLDIEGTRAILGRPRRISTVTVIRCLVTRRAPFPWLRTDGS